MDVCGKKSQGRIVRLRSGKKDTLRLTRSLKQVLSPFKIQRLINTLEDAESDEPGQYGTYKEYKEMEQQQKLASQIKELVELDVALNIKISDYLTLRTAGIVWYACRYRSCKSMEKILTISKNNEKHWKYPKT